jgi:hypothetical protein
MTESSPPQSPDSGNGATPLQRVLMDRARAHAERDLVKPPRRPVQAIVGMVLAIVVVTVILLGFSAFLASVQRALHVMDEQEKTEVEQKQIEVEQRKTTEPMPAYMVPPADPPRDPPPP